MTTATLETKLQNACAEVGIMYRDVPPDGRWHQTDVEGDRHGKGDGRIKAFADGSGGIVFNWKGESRVVWADDQSATDPAEQAERDLRRKRAIAEAEKEVQEQQAAAAGKAAAVWKAARPAENTHPYLLKKGVQPQRTVKQITGEALASGIGYSPKSSGEPLAGVVLVVPVKVEDALSTVEFIDEDGRKAALAGGRKAGGYWASQRLPEDDGSGKTLCIGEGMATVQSVRQASGYYCVAALSRCNLVGVAQYMRKRYPMIDMILLADVGDGQKDAEAAAKAVCGKCIVPAFTAEEVDTFTAAHGKPPADFNDLLQLRGLDGLKQVIVPSTLTERMSQRYAKIDTGEYRCIDWPWPVTSEMTKALLPGMLTIIVGSPGASKSFSLLQAALYWIGNDEDVAVFAYEDDIEFHTNRLLAQKTGNSGFTDPNWLKEHVEDRTQALQKLGPFLETFSRHWHIAEDGQDTLDDVAAWIEQEAKRGRRIIAVDPITMAERTAQPWIADKAFVKQVKRVMTKYQASLILVTHPQRGQDASMEHVAGGAAYQQFTPTIIAVHRNDERKGVIKALGNTYNRTYNATFVLEKTRNARGQGLTIAFEFMGDSLSFMELGILVKEHRRWHGKVAEDEEVGEAVE